MKGEDRRIWGEEEENTDYGRIVRPSQQDVTPYEKGFSAEVTGSSGYEGMRTRDRTFRPNWSLKG